MRAQAAAGRGHCDDMLVHRARAACPRLCAIRSAGRQVLGAGTGTCICICICICTSVALHAAAGLLARREASIPWPFVASVLRPSPGLRRPVAADAWNRDVGMFRWIFHRATGLTTSDYRQRFRLRTPRRDRGRDMPR
jgi:transcriptional regulator GlxA family with amidase domain